MARLSTNAVVRHYQLTSIPCPRFGVPQGNLDKTVLRNIEKLIAVKDFASIGNLFERRRAAVRR